VGAAIDIMFGDIDYLFFQEVVEWRWDGLFFFNEFFKVHGLIAKLPEMVFRVVLIAVGEKLKQAGVEVEVMVYEKVPHPIMALDGELIISLRHES